MKPLVALTVLFSITSASGVWDPQDIASEDHLSDDTYYLLTYNGKPGETYDDSNYVKADKSKFIVTEEPNSVEGHPSYTIQTPEGDLLLSGDLWGDGDGRGWATLFDKDAEFQWVWHSSHDRFDAILGAVVLPDSSIVLVGTRDIGSWWSYKWELLLVAVQSDGTEKWSTTLDLSSPNPPRKNGWSVIYWVDFDAAKKFLIIGGVVDHQAGAETIMWKSEGLLDEGGVPFIASIPLSKLDSAPTIDDIHDVHYFDYSTGYTTVVSLRIEHGIGVVALLPLNPTGGALARLTYDTFGKFSEIWVKSLSVQSQVTDIAIVGTQPVGMPAEGYVVMATVNPGAKVEAVAADGSSIWIHDYNIDSIYPPATKDQGYMCQECFSIWTLDEDIMFACGIAELTGGDQNCDDGIWRSLVVTFNYKDPTNASYTLFHPSPDENFSLEYASYGANGEIICAIDADSGGSIVKINNSTSTQVQQGA